MLGRLLGYPDCCASAFARRWKAAATEHQGDVVAACIASSGDGPHDWRVNILGRYFGSELIQHFPCRFDCAQSIALAAQNDRLLASWEPALHASFRGILDAPVLYTDTCGVAILSGATVDGSSVHYRPEALQVTEPDGALHAALRNTNVLQRDRDGRHLRVAGAAFRGSLVVFAESAAVA